MPKDHRGETHWPTLEEQFAAAHVIPGLALEKLIRENQDFDMLRPEEAHDKLRLPPWIRVYWRKLHPEGNYSGASGGYPMVLRELCEWMIEHQDLPDPEVPEIPPRNHPPADRPAESAAKKGDRRGK